MSVRGLKLQRGYVAALAGLAGYPQRPKPCPCRLWVSAPNKPGITGCRIRTSRLFQQRSERATPAGAQRGNAQRPLQPVCRVTRPVQKRIHLGDGHALGSLHDPHDLVAGPDFSLFKNTEIETGPAMRDEQCGHFRLIHPDADPVAGNAGLADFE